MTASYPPPLVLSQFPLNLTGPVHTKGPIYDVFAFGAVGDGTTDDTAAIQAAIDALPSSGGVVYLPAATYVVNGTLNLTDKENVRLRGDGAANAVYQAVSTKGTILKRVSGTGLILDWSASAATQSLRGCGIEGITFDGNNLATTVVRLSSLYGGVFRDLHIREGTVEGLGLRTVNLPNVEDLQSCIFENISIRCVATATAKGLTADSFADGGGNVSLNNFHNLIVVTQNGTGIELGDSDTNRFIGVECNRTGTAIGIDLLASNHASSGHARHNVFLHVDAVGGITSRATGFSLAAQNNYVLLSRGNSTPLPTIEDGSTLFMHGTNGTMIGFRLDHRRDLYLKDDFIAGATATSELQWQNMGGTISRVAGLADHPGILRYDTTATSGTLAGMTLGQNGTGTFLPAEMFDMTWILRLNTNDANTLVRIGLEATGNSNPDSNGIYIEKLAADTQWFGVTRAASSQNRTTALANVSTNWVKFRIRRVNATTVAFSLDDGAETTATLTIPTVALQPILFITNSTTASKTIDIDFFELYIGNLGR
jgi:hypothetical protein